MPQPFDKSSLPELSDLCRKHHLDLLVLFGSQVKGEIHAHSDFDLAAVPERGFEPDLVAATMDFSRRLQRGDVELVIVTTNDSPVLLWEIFTSGIPLYEARPDLFEDWVVLTHKIYWDTEKFRRWQRLSLEKWLEEENVT
jgi:predicted nucleotidyltransferase